MDRLEPLPERVAILRALPGLGDFLCAVPALRALRAGLPDAHITLIGLPSTRALVRRFGRYVDEFIEFPGWPGLPERTPALDQLPLFIAHVQQQAYDLALQMHGSGTITNPLAVLLGARRNAGFYLPGQYRPDPEGFLPFAEHESEIRRNLRLITLLGIPARGEALEFPVTDKDRDDLTSLAVAHDLQPGQYACIHAGARSPDRRWPPDRFAAVGDALARKGLRVVLTGTADEAPLTRAVAQAMRAPALDLAGQTGLGALAVLLCSARLLVCNDTGTSHLATALGVPSVVIFTTTDPNRWAPLDRELHRVVTQPADMDGQSSLDISRVCLETVLEEVDDLLRENVADAA